MLDLRTPGVYIEEIPKLPPSIASVQTAIPAFIGYTQKAIDKTVDLTLKPKRITSMLEYETYFGRANPETGIIADFVNEGTKDVAVTASIDSTTASVYLLYYAMQMFYANGGGPCHVISVGDYSTGIISAGDFDLGLDEAAKVDEVTLLVIPEAVNIPTGGTAITDYYALYKKALTQCNELQDRFTVMDVYPGGIVQDLRDEDLGEIEFLKYGAAYYPRLFTTIDYDYPDGTLVTVNGVTGSTDLDQLKTNNNAYYNMARAAINGLEMLLPVAPAVVGKYALTDNKRGVWKAPANVGISLVTRPEVVISHNDQMTLNVDDVTGKSINAIRSFPGRGAAIIWGARTLAGNDNEWRYVPVRRFFNMVEESVKNASEQFVFEPNDENTWTRVKSMIENYLTTQWKNGALMGASTKEAFYVHIGLGSTMSELDIWEGRMIIEIGMAVVRPAEFIILKFMHKMLSEA